MKTHLRQMTPTDVPAVLEKLREQNERDNTSYGMPDVFDAEGKRLPNIPLALVAVTEDGEVVQGHVYERTLEQLTFGINPEATVCSMHEQEAVSFVLREKGYADLNIFVPVQRVPQMEHGLQRILGMTKMDEIMAHFYRRLDPAENAELREFYQSQRKFNHKRNASPAKKMIAGNGLNQTSIRVI